MSRLLLFIGILGFTNAQLSKTRSSDCGDNESYQTCGTACEPSCDTPNPTICTLQCVVGCQCETGYYRNSNGVCVTSEQCLATTVSNSSVISTQSPDIEQVINSKISTPNCATNETFSDCHNPCMEAKCPSEGTTVAVACIAMCMQGCSCSSGFVRDVNGQCVKTNDCLNSIADEVSNGTRCSLVKCSSGLECEEVEACEDSGTCVTQPACVKRVQLNSTIVGCSNLTCPVGEFCQQLEVNCLTSPCSPIVTCVRNDSNKLLNATQGCDVVQCETDEACREDVVSCKEESCPIRVSCVKYVHRNSTDSIISSKCSANETFSQCTNPCTESKCVSNTDFICTSFCSPGCKCEADYKRNTSGSCVKSADCLVTGENNLNTTTCGVNETLTDCYNSCSEEKCTGIADLSQCTSHCRVGCHCSEGFIRSNDGKCYEDIDCPDEQFCGQNEDYRCADCDASCTNPYPNCDNKNCTKSCQCAIGFVRLNDNCVSFKQCPSTTTNNITCSATEVYTDCLPKCSVTCTGNLECDDDIDEETCVPGCVCQTKYKRDTSGNCVHNRQCFKSTDCVDNEEWVKCKDNDLTCSVILGGTTKTPTRDSCNSGCACILNYARNSNGTCVPTSEC